MQDQKSVSHHICSIYCILEAFFFFNLLLSLAIFMKALTYLNHTSSYRSDSGYIMCDLLLLALK